MSQFELVYEKNINLEKDDWVEGTKETLEHIMKKVICMKRGLVIGIIDYG